MASWREFSSESPGMAAEVAERFQHHKHCLLATLRSDGSPRISGIEVWWWGEDLWFGLMPNSTKGADLERDHRFELHSAPTDLNLQQPDARLRGTADRVNDETTLTAFIDALPHPPVPPDEIAVYRVDLTGAVLVRVSGDDLVLDSWEPGTSPRRHTRR